MTGYSHHLPTTKKIASLVCIVSGSALLIEHLYVYKGFDLFDAIGHEYYGLLLILLGFVLSLKWGQLKAVKKAWKDRKLHALLDEGERE